MRELFKKFIRVQVRHVPRVENSWADALAKLATASREDLDRLVPVEHLPEPSVNVDNEESVPGNVRAELDGPHLGLLGGRNIAK